MLAFDTPVAQYLGAIDRDARAISAATRAGSIQTCCIAPFPAESCKDGGTGRLRGFLTGCALFFKPGARSGLGLAGLVGSDGEWADPEAGWILVELDGCAGQADGIG